MFARKLLQRLLRDTRGATAIEYGMIASLIVVAIITAMQGFANASSDLWDLVQTKYEDSNNN